MSKLKRTKNDQESVIDSRKKKFLRTEQTKKGQKIGVQAPQKVEPKIIAKKQKQPSRMLVFANRFGWTEVEILSKGAHKVLPILSENFLVRIVKTDKDSCTVAVKSKHLSQVIAILNKLCYDYKIIKIIGVVPTLIRSLSRLGVGVGIAIVAVAFVICSTFVTRVSVDGVREPALRQQIVTLLEENGVKRGGKVGEISLDELSQMILALDGVAFASVKRSGGHVSVYVREELPPAEIVEFSNAGVVAKKRAVVTRVIVDGGTAVVGYGDVVSTGDTLIAGYTEYGDEKIPVEAVGEAYGKVYHQKKLYFANTTLKKTYGDVKTVTKLSFFHIVPKTPACKFEDYELEVSKKENEFFVPYTAYTYLFREIVSVEEQEGLSLDEQKQRAYSQVLSDIDTAVKVLNVYFEVEETEGGRYVTATVETEEKIS